MNNKPVNLLCGFLGLCFMAGLLCACEDVLVTNYIGERTVKITTDPPECRIVLESMGSRQVFTYYSPVQISYAPKPGMPTKISVSKEGYQTKNFRLEGDQNHLHIVLERMMGSSFEGSGIGLRGGGGIGSMPGGETGGGAGPPGAFGGSHELPTDPSQNKNMKP